MPEPHDYDTDARDPGGHDETVVAGTPVVVRRNAGLAALIGAGASAIAIAYLWRASQSGTLLDWGLCLVLALIAGFYLSNLVDARTPLVVADDLGVRIRLGNQWRGLPWDAVNQIVVQPRRGLARDGRLMFTPHSLGRALDGLDARGRRQAAMNQKMYGAALAVPIGLTTRVSQPEGEQHVSLADQMAVLSRGRADVVVVLPEPEDRTETPADDRTDDRAAVPAAVAASPAPAPVEELAPGVVEPAAQPSVAQPSVAAEQEPGEGLVARLARRIDDFARTLRPDSAVAVEPEEPLEDEHGLEEERAGLLEDARQPHRQHSFVGNIGTIVSRVAKGRSHDVDADPIEAPLAPAASAVPLRETRPASRAEITRDTPATILGTTALHESADGRRGDLPEGRELRRPGSVDLVIEPVEDARVRPISQFGEPVAPLVIDDFVTEPAYDPVIGPELAAARTRLGLSVDELADRTRIRPHVIESIEVDDFAPCGGDFYARGHLRTLARVLGKEVAPMLEQFDARYATAPINARRVFEAELATGTTGSMRSTLGGPNWGLLVGVVLSLVLVWGVVRLFATEPPELLQSPAPVLNGSAGVGHTYPEAAPVAVGKPVHVSLVAVGAGSRVVVRNGDERVVFAGPIEQGRTKTLKVMPPVRVRADDGGAVTVRVNGKNRGAVGEPGKPGARTLHRPSH